jgi:hypothetical protein
MAQSAIHGKAFNVAKFGRYSDVRVVLSYSRTISSPTTCLTDHLKRLLGVRDGPRNACACESRRKHLQFGMSFCHRERELLT